MILESFEDYKMIREYKYSDEEYEEIADALDDYLNDGDVKRFLEVVGKYAGNDGEFFKRRLMPRTIYRGLNIEFYPRDTVKQDGYQISWTSTLRWAEKFARGDQYDEPHGGIVLEYQPTSNEILFDVKFIERYHEKIGPKISAYDEDEIILLPKEEQVFKIVKRI